MVEEDVEAIEHAALFACLEPWTIVLVSLTEALRHAEGFAHCQIEVSWPKPGGRTHDIGAPLCVNSHVAQPKVAMQQPRTLLSYRREDEVPPYLAFLHTLHDLPHCV